MQFFLPQPPQQPGPFKAALNAFIAEELVLTAPSRGPKEALQAFKTASTRVSVRQTTSGSRAGCELLPTPPPPDQCRRPRRKKERRRGVRQRPTKGVRPSTLDTTCSSCTTSIPPSCSRAPMPRARACSLNRSSSSWSSSRSHPQTRSVRGPPGGSSRQKGIFG
jgi:hypothetical protein